MKNKIALYILIVIIPLYFLQGWIFESGSLASQCIAAIWLLIDVIYLIKCLKYGLIDRIGRTFISFWLLNTVTWLFAPLLINNNVNVISWGATYSVYKNISVVFLTYFPFYYLKLNCLIEKRQLRWFTFISLICLIVAFFVSSGENAFVIGESDITNNGAYYLVVTIPLLGLFFDQIIKYIFLGVILILVLSGAKRGAILCAAIEYFFFIYFYIKNIRKSRSLFKLTWASLAVLVIFYMAINLYERNDYLQMRYEQTISGDSSSRDEIYSLAFQKFNEQDFINQLLGSGMNSTLSIIKDYAHQDWLELLINNGILGIIFYLSVFVSILRYYQQSRRSMIYAERFMFLSAVFAWFIRSMFSMTYYSIETCFLVISLAIVSANHRR